MSAQQPSTRLKSRFAEFLFAWAAKLRGYKTTEYGRGYSDGWRAGATEAVRRETVDELIASVREDAS